MGAGIQVRLKTAYIREPLNTSYQTNPNGLWQFHSPYERVCMKPWFRAPSSFPAPPSVIVTIAIHYRCTTHRGKCVQSFVVCPQLHRMKLRPMIVACMPIFAEGKHSTHTHREKKRNEKIKTPVGSGFDLTKTQTPNTSY